MPEDEPEFSSLWEPVSNSELQVLNYGESLEVEGMDEMVGSEPEGRQPEDSQELPNKSPSHLEQINAGRQSAIRTR
jgi:hypothetical protein